MATGLVVLALVCGGQASAGTTHEQIKSANRTQIDALQRHRDVLRGDIDATHGRIDLINDYLYSAMAIVYYAKATANYGAVDGQSTNSDLTSLVSSGYLPQWPANPLNNWEPMRYLPLAARVSPGDLVFELAPSSESTTLKRNTFVGSFNLYIYGVDGDVASEKLAILESNKAWSNPPAGAHYAISFYMSSDAERQAQKEKQRKKRQAEQESATK